MGRGLLLFAALVLFAAPSYRQALPGYRYEFPRDHFNHPEFQTEWWYYTGNVQARDGHRYGFELVFFRRGREASQTNPSVWRVDDLYLAHLALTDIDGRKFRSVQRLNRAGPGVAGVSMSEGRIWNGNWTVQWQTPGDVQTLSAIAEGIQFHLRLTPRKPVVIHGENGVSQTGAAPGQASYYTSFPLLEVEGTLNGAEVVGTAWMDHEWFTSLMDPGQVGWDWFSAQLENNTQLMLFQIRRTDGSEDPHSSATYIDPAGRATFLARQDFALRPLEFWTSPKTHARYPVKWHLEIPRLHVSLDCEAALPNQELTGEGEGASTYWEGAARYSGSVRGVGYLEMTGYDKAFKM
ncbi:MAG TPA: lipocalin-like domain-containing protein [Candidatus Sulfopaludibacter sp.]|jgi:predicted secreted hydrolase|nr:lipocalin-like domain-containing protein [Candidatus Sulfopaludibacter sp.]